MLKLILITHIAIASVSLIGLAPYLALRLSQSTSGLLSILRSVLLGGTTTTLITGLILVVKSGNPTKGCLTLTAFAIVMAIALRQAPQSVIQD